MYNQQDNYFKTTDKHNTETKWTVFKNILKKLTDKHVPSKLCKNKENLPWITKEIKRLMHKRDKLYSKNKQNKKSRKLKEIKHVIQSEIRLSYNSYLEKVLVDNNSHEENPRPSKRFWTFIKQKKV
jgi:hypothetical protein